MLEALPILRPQDIVVALAVHDLGNGGWTYAMLAKHLELPNSYVHAAVQRATASHLVEAGSRRLRSRNLLEFLEHGVRYAFPAEPGPITRGVPTSVSAPPLDSLMLRDSAAELVWPHVEGRAMGQGVAPLHANVPTIAIQNRQLHELLALVDAIRLGGVRERQLATNELGKRLGPGGA